MRRLVADSDDEDDDEVFVDASSNTHKRNAVSNPGSNGSNGEGANDSAIAKNTNSTELLRQQMLSAERHLVSNSAPMAAQSSPSMRAQKRRHSAVSSSGAATSPENAVKRLKTITTYGAKNPGRAVDESAFDHLRDDDVERPAPKTSQSARFTEHSGYHSSGELPAGSLGDGFADHEPAVMFRDSGSTVADDSSAQQRMLQHVLSSKKGTSTSAVNPLLDDDEKSSSFPWSASGQTQAKSTNQAKAAADNTGGGSGDEPHVNNESDADKLHGSHVNDKDAGAANSDYQDGRNGSSANVDVGATGSNENQDTVTNDEEEISLARSAPRPQASPVVEISQTTSRNKTSRRDSTSTQRSTKTRKRKSEENNDSEPLNSDDRAIGLPKERYQPRPSRRRSTQIVEEPIDYSVRPEKAAKAKRTKTNVAPAVDDREISKEHLANLKADVEKIKTPSKPAKKTSDPISTSIDKKEASVSETQDKDSLDETEEVAKTTASSPTEQTPSSSGKQNDDHFFKKPALPTPKPKAASQSRRSRTTIFEDHVEFAGSQKSPSLSQQQASRKSARKDIHVEAVKPSQRRKRVVEDEEDDEDELAKDPRDEAEASNEQPPPTKRGRGRPAKVKPQPKSAEKVLEGSEAEGGEDEDEDEDEPPKKKGRGRPPKAAAAPPKAPITGTDPTTNVTEKENSAPPPVQKDHPERVSEKEPDESATPRSTSHGIGKENLTPSPSPEKQMDKTAKTPQKDATPSPTLHSPIKNTLAVPLRVGLSSRRRIPSLLKTINPPRPRT